MTSTTVFRGLLRRSLLALAMGAAALPLATFTASTAQAADIKERTIRFSYVQPKTSHMGWGVEKFAELVAAKSGKKMTIKGFADGALGGDLQALSAVQGGTIEMTTMPIALMVGQVKSLGVFDAHFLFDNFAEVDAVLDGPVGQKFLNKLPPGLVGLGYFDHGFRYISNSKRAITKLEDIQGLKIRTPQSPVFLESFRAMGANPVPLSFTELYTAMETKTVDGQDNPIAAYETNKFFEVQKHLSNTRHVYQPLAILISKKSWDGFSADERQILTDAAREAAAAQRPVSRQMEATALEAVKKAGTVYTEISPAELVRIRDKVRPVTERYLKELAANEPAVTELVAEIEAVRARSK